MHKFTQRELLNEGFWSAFARAGIEAGKFVLPKASENIGKAVEGGRGVLDRIADAYTPMEKRVLEWMDEQGRVPLPDSPIKRVKKFRKGMHFAMKIAEKAVKENGDTTVGRMYRDPHAIVLYKKKENRFEWVVKPRSNDYKKDHSGRIIYGDRDVEPEGGDYGEYPQQTSPTIQAQPQQAPQQAQPTIQPQPRTRRTRSTTQAQPPAQPRTRRTRSTTQAQPPAQPKKRTRRTRTSPPGTHQLQ